MEDSPAGDDPVAAVIRKARDRYLRADGRRGISQRVAANLAGFGESTWYVAERPGGLRSDQTVAAIAKLFGFPPDWVPRVQNGATLEDLTAAIEEVPETPEPTPLQRIEQKIDHVTEVLERVAQALRAGQ